MEKNSIISTQKIFNEIFKVKLKKGVSIQYNPNYTMSVKDEPISGLKDVTIKLVTIIVFIQLFDF